MEITQRKIEELAPNAAAAKNGRDLVKKNKFSNLKISSEKNLIWGECAGSGKNPYYCSADYIEENNPVFRCNCPSRQFPCKHALGLLYAYEANNASFVTDDVPEDITSKREKIGKKQEKKAQEKESVKEKAQKPKKVNKAAFVKKADAQLSGIEIAGKILKDIVQTGLSSIDAKIMKTLQAQVKELGNYYINGVQTAFNDLLLEMNNAKNEEYTHVIDQINYISALLKKSTDYINKRKEDPEADPELNSAIEEQIGYVWKLIELMQYGLYEENGELVQLSFNSYDNPARREYVDEGIWLNLKTGKIYKTKNYRPYRAAKYIKEDNSAFDVLQLKEMYIYPGDQNPRIRWEAGVVTERKAETKDIASILAFASANYAETIKQVKSTIKNPLMDKHPVVLVSLHKAYINGGNLVVEDSLGNKLTLKDIEEQNISSTTNLKAILPTNPEGFALTVMINNDVQTGLLSAQPMSLITPEKIVRLMY
ncbi:SWIM zinc finger family protein [Dysgonomonas sp. 511]|uniref:SWIM zinc finger family protein n=1 Tax=Dysgonomonas sp. 511 TaxID=2302930 RepID=UPI0013D061A6|nr:SWIM zinc finger family protein [Dysgonomonas sp. 511]NDV77789.1 SWIM zinc finger family protein [Dysgonomonas sp. 511]